MVGQSGKSEMTELNPSTIMDWLDKASKDEVLAVAKPILDRIGNFDENYQRQFARTLDKNTLRIFENV